MERERERERESKNTAISFFEKTKLYSLDKLTLFISGFFTGFAPAFSVVRSFDKSLHKKPMNFRSLPDNGSASFLYIEKSGKNKSSELGKGN